MLVCVRVVQILSPILWKRAIDGLIEQASPVKTGPAPSNPVIFLVLWAVLKMSKDLIDDLRRFVWLTVENEASTSLSLKIFSHLHSLDVQWHVNRKIGETLRIQDRGKTSLNTLIEVFMFTITPTILDLVITSIYLAVFFLSKQPENSTQY